MRSNQYKDIRKAGRLNTWGTAATAAAGAGLYGVLNGNGGGNNPDAPWNDGQEVGNDNQQNNEFPWDNTQPKWTPRASKSKPQEQPVQTTVEPESTQTQPKPQEPIKRDVGEPLEKVTGSTILGKAEPTTKIDSRTNNDLSLAQSAAKTMVQAPELAGRTYNNVKRTHALNGGQMADLRTARNNVQKNKQNQKNIP